MAATREGGLKAAETNKQKYGPDYYIKLGHMGGTAFTLKPKGFASMDKEELKKVSRKGGTTGRRGKRRGN